MSNETNKGLHYNSDALSTLINTGVYTLEFRVPKRIQDLGHADKIRHLKEGNYLRFQNRQNIPLLMTIMSITENPDEKIIYAEDTSIALINTIVHGIEPTETAHRIDYYLNETLRITGFTIGRNESTDALVLDFSSSQNALERIRQIVEAFKMEFYFSVSFENPHEPNFQLNIVKKRLEGKEGFRVSSDNVVNRIERKVNTANIITKVYIQGRAIEQEVATTTPAPVKPTPVEPTTDTYIEATIAEAMRIRAMKLPYRWGGNGLSGFDCSGFVSWCFRTAKFPGYPTTGRPTTNSMWNGSHSNYFTKISRSEVRRGDILLWDTGYTYPGDANHTGIALDNKQAIHSGNPNGIIQNIDSMKFIGAIRVK